MLNLKVSTPTGATASVKKFKEISSIVQMERVGRGKKATQIRGFQMCPNLICLANHLNIHFEALNEPVLVAA